jgi:hypothetical protein
MIRKNTRAFYFAPLLVTLFAILLMIPAKAQIKGESESNSKQERRPFKNNASEFSYGFLIGYFDVSDLNGRLKTVGRPEFSSFNASLPINYQLTLPGGWALGAEFMILLDQREENSAVENRINYNNFKILVGKDFLRHENRRLIAYLGGGIGTSRFTSTQKNTQSIDFDAMLAPDGPRNTLLTESFLWSMDFRLVYEWFVIRSSGTKYDKWSIIGGYHLPLSNRYRSAIVNSPEFRPAGP